MTEGKVSATAVRYYSKGDHVPQASYAKEAELLFGPDDGERLLRLWGHDDLADGFADDFNIIAGDHDERLMEVWSGNQLSYPALDEDESIEVLRYIEYVQQRS